MENIKILFITSQFYPPRSTGCGNSSALIFRELVLRGYDVDLLIFDKSLYESDYKKTQYGNFYRRQSFLSIINELKKINDGEYDIIHQYGAAHEKEILTFLYKKFKKTKLVTTINGIWPACWHYLNYNENDEGCCRFPKNFKCAMEKRNHIVPFFPFAEYFYRKIQRRLIKKYDKFFVLSKPLETLFVKGGFDRSKMVITPNFYDADMVEKLKKITIIESKKTIILYVGQLKFHKGVHNLIKAFQYLNTKNAELWIVGDGPEKIKLENLCKNGDGIKFFGSVSYKSDDFLYYFKQADIFVHPGLWAEPFGRTILEAAISNNAIIVSNIGAPPYILKDKALIYDPNDIQGLAECLKELIRNPNKRKKLADEVHNYILKEYSLEKSIDKLEIEYEKLLKN
jgi:glycosyltransferase involved in cell wall biosynthesis